MKDGDDLRETERRHRRERASRIGRLRTWLRHLPRRSNVHRYPVVRRFADTARRRPYLWSFKAPEVRRAIYTGAIIAFLPVYGLQLFFAFAAALLVRANLPIACALQVITNPLTAGPTYYATYRIGIWIIRTLDVGEGWGTLGTRFNALVLGGIVAGVGTALAVDLIFWLLAWEARRLRERHQRERQAAKEPQHQARGSDIP